MYLYVFKGCLRFICCGPHSLTSFQGYVRGISLLLRRLALRLRPLATLSSCDTTSPSRSCSTGPHSARGELHSTLRELLRTACTCTRQPCACSCRPITLQGRAGAWSCDRLPTPCSGGSSNRRSSSGGLRLLQRRASRGDRSRYSDLEPRYPVS